MRKSSQASHVTATRQIHNSNTFSFAREQMFDVVADVAQYHHFVPWCRRSDVLEEHENVRITELEIGFPPLHESYQSRVILVRPSVVHTTFRFAKDTDHSCVLHYDLVFEFKYSLHSQIAHLFFDKVVTTMVGAFLHRAETIHGKPTISHSKAEILRYRN
ncbi:unnamed protein product [Heligmosomoides polygyrus]|uniref:Polyketide_cyc domain-containing protein n=1 Tax=Heligmosomoides polygyrus TaxID=6339 RepID=A0A183FJW1_HELPZ|nr:unnamed protein product [Heligmosomoides polygyrus]